MRGSVAKKGKRAGRSTTRASTAGEVWPRVSSSTAGWSARGTSGPSGLRDGWCRERACRQPARAVRVDGGSLLVSADPVNTGQLEEDVTI